MRTQKNLIKLKLLILWSHTHFNMNLSKTALDYLLPFRRIQLSSRIWLIPVISKNATGDSGFYNTIDSSFSAMPIFLFCQFQSHTIIYVWVPFEFPFESIWILRFEYFQTDSNGFKHIQIHSNIFKNIQMNSNGNSNGIQMIPEQIEITPRRETNWQKIKGNERQFLRLETQSDGSKTRTVQGFLEQKNWNLRTRPNGMKISIWLSCVLANLIDQSINNGQGMNKKSVHTYLLYSNDSSSSI